MAVQKDDFEFGVNFFQKLQDVDAVPVLQTQINQDRFESLSANRPRDGGGAIQLGHFQVAFGHLFARYIRETLFVPDRKQFDFPSEKNPVFVGRSIVR